LKITLNDGTSQEYNPTHNSADDELYNFNIPAGEEFTGFWINGHSSA
jgi:hypothetical protein